MAAATFAGTPPTGTFTCRSCGQAKDASAYAPNEFTGGGKTVKCRDCHAAARAARASAGPSAPRGRRQVQTALGAAVADALPTPDAATDYIPMDELIGTWAALQLLVRRGDPAANMLFLGPKGSGKTEAAKHLAAIADLPFTQVDAPAMTDPEAWFGTREVIEQNGASVTVVRDSAFITAVQHPGVLLVDEINRVSDHIRGILLSLKDSTRAVTNPLTGQPVSRHPECFIIMTANVGLAYTGVFAMDPALTSRAYTTNFRFLEPAEETRIAMERFGVTEEQAAPFIRIASDSRRKAATDEDFPPIGTREVMAAVKLVSVGLDADTAAHQAFINAAPEEGGAQSIRFQLESMWTGVRRS